MSDELQITKNKSGRGVLSYWPMLVCFLPIIYVYVVKYFGYDELCSRGNNEMLAMPLVFVSVVSYGVLAWRGRNEFALVMFVLSLGFFCREWHFVGTSNGVYVVLAIVGGWFVVRRKQIGELINGTRPELWAWATFACYAMAQVVARRVFGPKYLDLLPMEADYHIFFEETIETTAHIMLALTSFVAWKEFFVKKNNQSIETGTE
ncbi:MAG: hypothetical protein KAS23_07150 [Anaerohalosphaera sp.]|nr:hypothetical protein [Anaerohalosphaera sp.]